MSSTIFQNLERNVTYVLSVLRNFPSTDASEPENQVKLRSCLALIHAEFEEYFETIAMACVENYGHNKISHAQFRSCSYFMLCYSPRSFEGEADDTKKRIEQAILLYKRMINKNHGILSKNILKIILPLGYPIARIDQTWLNTIDSFGTFRGEMVHHSISKIKKLVSYNYFDRNVMEIILSGIKDVDNYLYKNYRL